MLDRLTPNHICHFYRDRGAFEFLTRELLPTLAAQAGAGGRNTLKVWSAGCASGEEPYTLAIIWEFDLPARFPTLAIRILATDVHPAMLAHARRACFAAGSLRELPEHWRSRAFEPQGALYWLRALFVPPELAAHASVDEPVRISHQQVTTNHRWWQRWSRRSRWAPDQAAFDAIIVTAAFLSVPPRLVTQLVRGGSFSRSAPPAARMFACLKRTAAGWS